MNEDLKTRAAQATGGAIEQAAAAAGQELAKPVDRRTEVRDLLTKMLPQMQLAMPKSGLTAERLNRLVATSFNTTPDLLACSTMSLLAGVMEMAALGLEPGILGLCYLLPFDNRRKVGSKWETVKEAVFVIGYKGELELARRSGEIKRINARVVYEQDDFKIIDGLHADLVHVRHLGDDKGEPLGAYVVAEYTNGGFFFDYMTKSEIERVRDTHAKGYLKDGKPNPKSPWVAEWEAMWCKTLVRHSFKWLPVSTEIATMAMADETVRTISANATAEDIQVMLASPSEDLPVIEGTATVVDDKPVDATAAPSGDDTAPQTPKATRSATKKGQGQQKASEAPAPEVEEPPAEDPPTYWLCECGDNGTLAADTTKGDLADMKCPTCRRLGSTWQTSREPFPPADAE